ncbi:MAG: hypothetical protein U0836_16325 [Pirellulales bacterium]
MLSNKDDIATIAAQCRDGVVAARIVLTRWCVVQIGEMDRDTLIRSFRAYAHDVAELARSMGLERIEQNAALENCALAASKGDEVAHLRMLQFMLKMATEATHALFLTLKGAPHVTIGGPGNGPPDNRVRVGLG